MEGVAKPSAPVFKQIRTVEDGISLVEERLRKLRESRDQCDLTEAQASEVGRIMFPGLAPAEAKIRVYQRAGRQFLVRYGECLGTLAALMHTRKLTDEAYARLRDEVMQTMIPTVNVISGVRV